MKIKQNFLAPLHLACSKDEKSKLQYIFFKDSNMYATDAHVLIVQSYDFYCSVEGKENMEGKAIHRDTFQQILKKERVVATPDGFECYDKGDKVFYPYNEVKPPNFNMVLGKIKKEGVPVIGIDPRYIEIAAKCLYADNVKQLKFTFSGTQQPIKVELVDRDYYSQTAYIMPVLVEK